MKRAFSLLGISLLALAACTPNVQTRGHIGEATAYASVVVGQTTRDQVRTMLGSPSSASSFGEETWYYVTSTKESVAFFKPEITSQSIVRIIFSTDGVVRTVERFNAADMQHVAFAARETKTEGQELTVIDQLLGNMGKFNAPGTTPGSAGASGPRGRR